MKEKGDMWVPLKKKTHKRNGSCRQRDGASERYFFNFFSFSLLSLLSSIHGVPTVGFRRVKHEKCSTRRGLRVGTKNTGFHREFR